MRQIGGNGSREHHEEGRDGWNRKRRRCVRKTEEDGEEVCSQQRERERE